MDCSEIWTKFYPNPSQHTWIEVAKQNLMVEDVDGKGLGFMAFKLMEKSKESVTQDKIYTAQIECSAIT